MNPEQIRQLASGVKQTLIDIWRSKRPDVTSTRPTPSECEIAQLKALSFSLFELLVAAHTWGGELTAQFAELNASMRSIGVGGSAERAEIEPNLYVEYVCPNCHTKRICRPRLAPLMAITRSSCEGCGFLGTDYAITIRLDPLQLAALGALEQEKSVV